MQVDGTEPLQLKKLKHINTDADIIVWNYIVTKSIS